MQSVIPYLTSSSPDGLKLKGSLHHLLHRVQANATFPEKPLNAADIHIGDCAFLILTPSSVSSNEILEAAAQRVAELSGRTRNAVLFFYHPSNAPSTPPSSEVREAGDQADPSMAFATLTHAFLTGQLDSSVPLLPVPEASALPDIVRSFLSQANLPIPAAPPAASAGQLVAFCTTAAEGELERCDYLAVTDEWGCMRDFVRGVLAGGVEGVRRVIGADEMEMEHVTDWRGRVIKEGKGARERAPRGIWEFWAG